MTDAAFFADKVLLNVVVKVWHICREYLACKKKKTILKVDLFFLLIEETLTLCIE